MAASSSHSPSQGRAGSATLVMANPRGTCLGATNPHRHHPVVKYTTRGRFDGSPLTDDDRARLSADLEGDVLAVGTAIGRASSMRTWGLMHRRWFGTALPLLPLTTPKICAVAAQMKAGGYRSFPNFVGAVKDEHVATLHAWTDELERCRRRCIASTQRGIGPPRQCLDVPIAKIAELQFGADPLVVGGPVCPGHWATICCFHLVRGAEAACALASSLVLDLEAKTETWHLPASKTDPTAIGVKRTWGCVCGCEARIGVYAGVPPCPFHAALALQHDLKRRFANSRGALPSALPLFPDASGNWCTRSGFVETITAFTNALEMDVHDDLGRNQVGEHVWRVSGSRMLASIDIPQPVIMLLARWGSRAILRYVADAPLSQLTAAYLARVKAAASFACSSPSVGDTLQAGAPLCDAPTLSLAESAAEAILEAVPAACVAKKRFTANEGTEYVHLIADRRPWERPKPGRTACGWDYLLLKAPCFSSFPTQYKMGPCGKCATPSAWTALRQSLDVSDSE